jgi:single-strand DNA-binding protein
MASRSVNKVILVGRLGKDAESKFTPSGTSVATFSIATSWRQKDQQTGEWKENTDWHNIVFWRSENVAPYLTKGTQVYIEGRLHTRNYENKEGKKVYVTEVVAEELILLGGRQGGEASGGEYSQQPVSMPRSAQRPPAAAAAPAPAEDAGFDQGVTDDDVPF